MRFLLFALLLLVLSPGPSRAQGHLLAQATPVPALDAPGSAFDGPASDRAGGGVAGGALVARPLTEDRLWKAPARTPYALPNPAYALFIPEYLRPKLPRAVAPALRPAVSEAAAPSAAIPAVSAGVVRARSEMVYYEVDGKSREDLAAALHQHGPRLQGAQFFGVTEWEVGAEYRPAKRTTDCAIDDLTVRVMVQTRLPRWTPPAGASPALSGAWERFVTALDRHEHGHRALAEEAAEAIRQRLASVRTAACDQLDPVAQREMAVVMREYESHNLAYDAETGHGRTQGAVWPPRN